MAAKVQRAARAEQAERKETHVKFIKTEAGKISAVQVQALLETAEIKSAAQIRPMSQLAEQAGARFTTVPQPQAEVTAQMQTTETVMQAL